jgi:hypothetical protein
LPKIDITAHPTPKITADSQNTGVIHEDGSQKSPTFDHHVDNLMSAAI